MNFDFLKPFPEFGELYRDCSEAERSLAISPTVSATAARRPMEYLVRLLYRANIGDDTGKTVFELLDDSQFEAYIGDETILTAMHTIRKTGNIATHGGQVGLAQALGSLEQLHYLVGETCMLLGLVDDYPMFVDPTAQPSPEEEAPSGLSNEPPLDPVAIEPEVVTKFAPRLRHAKFDCRKNRDEMFNKRLFISASLREADWPITTKPNQAIPAAASLNCMLDSGTEVDYILRGRDNRPLAVIDYSTTCTEGPLAGRNKVKHIAEELGQKLGYKPIAYYSNGYRIYCIDQLGYPPRRVFNFHSIDELELLKQRATSRQDITNPVIDDNITNRDYQKQAITAVCRAFAANRRKSLLVMATGTGKTRVSISLVSILTKAGWAKNVLFLADRTSLVRQAHKKFNKLLPNVTTSIYTGGDSERDSNARIIFSTYQTMINLVNDETREFGVGRFDLIVIDEAHRSIFNKYGALFDYFDALMIGLTATPRSEENRSTYEVFELPNGKPDYAYELDEAIADGYLVGFQVLDRTTAALRRGVRYDDLSPDEKVRFEETFANENDVEQTPDFTGATFKLSSGAGKLINKGTIGVMLGDLMKNGLKIDAGDKLGKTIIFAGSHKEAEIIVEQFQKTYTYFGPDFCKLIDSQVENNPALIDAFGERDSMPQIAVSVDMLDTGIDVPDIVNLVFFKSVRSKIKFLQMVGRGTRLSPDLFGPGVDKQGFLIFDYYDNFNYFSLKNTWEIEKSDIPSRNTLYSRNSQSVSTNRRRLSLLRQLQEHMPTNAFDAAYRDDLRQSFIAEVQSLNNDDVMVEYNLSYVNKYRIPENWDCIDDDSQTEIEEHILPLLPSDPAPARVKSFDALMFTIEDEYRKRELENKDPRKIRHGFYNVCRELTRRMEVLLKLKTIPEIVQNEQLITSMIDGNYLFDDFSLERAEGVRKQLRDLMVYLPDEQRYYIVDFPDTLIAHGERSGLENKASYAEKASDYLENSGDPALAKLRNLDPLTDNEKASLEETFTTKLGTKSDYLDWSGNAPLLPFLRRQVGISNEAIGVRFGSFLNNSVFDEEQLAFLRQIIVHARENGDITYTDIQTVSPFCDIDPFDFFGDKVGYFKQLVDGLHKPIL